LAHILENVAINVGILHTRNECISIKEESPNGITHMG